MVVEVLLLILFDLLLYLLSDGPVSAVWLA